MVAVDNDRKTWRIASGKLHLDPSDPVDALYDDRSDHASVEANGYFFGLTDRKRGKVTLYVSDPDSRKLVPLQNGVFEYGRKANLGKVAIFGKILSGQDSE